MPFILALLMSAAAAVSAYGGDFNELDALFREDARLKMELAGEKANFADEERMLDAEISASEALVSELKKKIDSLQKRLESATKNDAAVAKKIARDESAFGAISKILDTLYFKLSEKLSALNSKILPLSKREFESKTVNEKFREFASLYARSRAADRELTLKDGFVCTGLFVKASGKSDKSGVAEIKVETPEEDRK